MRRTKSSLVMTGQPPVQRLLSDGMFCDVSSESTANQPANVDRANFLDVETVWNELTSVIPRIEMIARYFTAYDQDECIVQYDTEKNIHGAFQAEPICLPRHGSCVGRGIRTFGRYDFLVSRIREYTYNTLSCSFYDEFCITIQDPRLQL